MPKKLVYFITLSLSGHLNPVCGLVHELAKNPDIECVIYGIEDHREKIERTGARFRAYLHRNGANINPVSLEDIDKNGHLYEQYINDQINCAYIQVPAITDDVRREKPDLIVYDPNFFPIKYLQQYLEKERFSVRFLEFFPNFVLTNQLKSDIPELVRMNFKLYAMSFRIFLKQIQLSYHFGIPLHHPMNLFSGFEKNTRLVAVFPELHPRLNDYDPKTNKFIGECISEEARNNETAYKDMELKSLLDQFPLNKNKASLVNSSSPKLIYVSLGTLFCVNTFIFELIIEAIRKIDPSRFRVVFSVGEKSLKSLMKKIEDGELIVPETIMLRTFVPQLEVLERADLFVTHSGMNSTSEAIRYGVPVISIPIEGDQPYNARRVCDELELGIRLDPRKLTADLIADTIEKVLGDEKYARNAKELSDVSARYNGPRDGAKFIVDFLNQIEN